MSAEAARAAAGPQDPLTFGLAWAGVLAFVALAIAGVNVCAPRPAARAILISKSY